MALAFVATVTGRWFVKHRGLVTGVLTAGGAAGQLVFLPVLAWLVERYGWRAAALAVAGAALAVVPLVLWLLRDRPADLGLPAYGATEVAPPPAPPTSGAARRARRRAAATPRGPARSGCSPAGSRSAARPPTAWSAPTSSRPRTTTAWPRRPRRAAGAGRAVRHRRHDRVGLADRPVRPPDPARRLLRAARLLAAGAAGAVRRRSAQPSMLVFILFYGLDWVATVPPTVALCREYFGDRGAVVFGWVFASHQIGAAVAATAGGRGPRPARQLRRWPGTSPAAAGDRAAGLSLLLFRRPGRVTLTPAMAGVPGSSPR